MLFKQFILFSFLSFKKYSFYNIYNIYKYNSLSKKKGALIDYSNTNNSSNNMSNNNNSNNNNYKKDIINYTQYLSSWKLYPIIANNQTKSNIRPSGIDERFNVKNPELTDSDIKKIIDNHQNKKLLDKLTNTDISQLDKLKLIENSDYLSKLNKNTINEFKMLNGGLMRDW